MLIDNMKKYVVLAIVSLAFFMFMTNYTFGASFTFSDCVTNADCPDYCAGSYSIAGANCDCSTGWCSCIGSTTTYCPTGCSNGACASSCPSGCDNFCSGNTRYYGGSCSDGSCGYSSEHCSYQCQPDGCVQDPCAGVTCNDVCADSHHLNVDGYCSGGTCNYSPDTFYCSYGCSNGACNAGPSCTNACTPGTKQCSGFNVQTCADYNGDGCYEWGGDQQCTVGCQNGACMSGPYQCVSQSYCTLSTAGTCGVSQCGGIEGLNCAANQRCNYYESCDYIQNFGKKVCYECVTDASCCTEGMTGSVASDCTNCNANWYLSSGHCCATGSAWDDSRGTCRVHPQCYNYPCTTDPTGYTTSWLTNMICVNPSTKQACCVFQNMYGNPIWFDWSTITHY